VNYWHKYSYRGRYKIQRVYAVLRAVPLDMLAITRMNWPVCEQALTPSAPSVTDLELTNPEKPEQQYHHYNQ
jgi:hypothetical protein